MPRVMSLRVHSSSLNDQPCLSQNFDSTVWKMTLLLKQENNKLYELIVKYLSVVWNFQSLNLNIWKLSLLLLLFLNVTEIG